MQCVECFVNFLISKHSLNGFYFFDSNLVLFNTLASFFLLPLLRTSHCQNLTTGHQKHPEGFYMPYWRFPLVPNCCWRSGGWGVCASRKRRGPSSVEKKDESPQGDEWMKEEKRWISREREKNMKWKQKKGSIEWNRIEYKDTWKRQRKLLWLYMSCQVWSEETFHGVREGNSSTAGRPTHPLAFCLNPGNRTKFAVRHSVLSQSQSIWLLSVPYKLFSFHWFTCQRPTNMQCFDWPSSDIKTGLCLISCWGRHPECTYPPVRTLSCRLIWFAVWDWSELSVCLCQAVHASRSRGRILTARCRSSGPIDHAKMPSTTMCSSPQLIWKNPRSSSSTDLLSIHVNPFRCLAVYWPLEICKFHKQFIVLSHDTMGSG